MIVMSCACNETSHLRTSGPIKLCNNSFNIMRKIYPQHKNKCYCCASGARRAAIAEHTWSSIKTDRKIDNQTDSVTPNEFIKTTDKYDIRATNTTDSESVRHESELIENHSDLDDCNLYRFSRYILLIE